MLSSGSIFFINTNNLVKLLSLHANLAFKLTKASTVDNRVKVVDPEYKTFLESLVIYHNKVHVLVENPHVQDHVSCLLYDLRFLHQPGHCVELWACLTIHHAISILYKLD